MLYDWARKLESFWFLRVYMPASVRHICGRKKISCAGDELVAVSLVKNAEVYINSFIDHHLELGIRHIFLLDNGSTDKTVELASRYTEVSIYSCRLPFRKYNLLMRQYLLRRFGRRNCWILCVDIDELFDYPYSDRIDLRSFLSYLTSRKYTAIAAYMLDMFPGLPISRLDQTNNRLKKNNSYYDISSVKKKEYLQYYPDHGYSNCFQRKLKLENIVSNPAVGHYTGGIRATMFNMPDVYLTKHPLVFIDGNTELVHQHFVNHAKVADISGLLYHYKFANGFKSRVIDALVNRQYWNDSFDYRKYHEVMKSNPDICLKTDSARMLKSVDELIDSGFIQVSKEYVRWCTKQEEKLPYTVKYRPVPA